MINRLLNEWANTGDKGTPPATEKIEAGFTRAEQPRFQRFNYLLNRVEQKINEIVSDVPQSSYDRATGREAMIASGDFSAQSWGTMVDTSNTMGGGSAKKYASLVSYIDANANSYIIVADNTAQKFEKWNARTLALDSTSSVFTAALPAGTWVCLYLCCDNTHFYGMFHDTAANVYRIQSWQCSDMTVNLGWAATGTALPGSGAPGGQARMIVASLANSKLATINPWITISAASSTAVSIIDSTDGTIDASGAGDCATGVSAVAKNGLASDGTNVYFFGEGTTPYLCSATIANPQVGTGGAGYPDALSASYTINGMVAAGNIIYSFIDPNNTISAAAVVVQVSQDTNSAITTVARGTDSAGNNSEYEFFEYPSSAVFDGLNVWFLGTVNNSADVPVLVKMEHAQVSESAGKHGVPDVCKSWNVHPGDATPLADINDSHIVFDGRDVWAIIETTSGASFSGGIYRFPMALQRG